MARSRTRRHAIKDRRVTQEQLAELTGIRQASVSKIENQDDMRLSTLRKYVEALGGRLEVRVRFSDRDVRLDPCTPIVP